MSTVQFYMARLVADALPIQGIAAEARGAGLTDATLQYSKTRWRPGETLVTCQMPVARFLLNRLQQLAADARASGDAGLIVASMRALEAAENAIAHPYSPDSGPASGIQRNVN